MKLPGLQLLKGNQGRGDGWDGVPKSLKSHALKYIEARSRVTTGIQVCGPVGEEVSPGELRGCPSNGNYWGSPRADFFHCFISLVTSLKA